MLPDALPGAVGANCALKVLDCPGGRESGKFSPLMPKPAPLALPCEIFKLAVPVFVKVTGWVLAVPTVRFPKPTLPGEMESCCLTPLPLWGTLDVQLEAILPSETLQGGGPV